MSASKNSPSGQETKENEDRRLMPPPAKLFRPGDQEFFIGMESNEVHLSLPDRKSAARWMNKMTQNHPNKHEMEHEDGWDILEDDVWALGNDDLGDRRKRDAYMPFLSSFSSFVPPSPEQLSHGSFIHSKSLQFRNSIESVDPCSSSRSASRKRKNMVQSIVQKQYSNPQMPHNAPNGSHYMKRDETQVLDDGKKVVKGEDADEECGENNPLEVDDEGGNATGGYGTNDKGQNDEDKSLHSNGSIMVVPNQEKIKNKKAGGSGGFQSSTTLFEGIIGHKSVKMRLEEVLLPLSLPPELAQSVLTGIRSLSPSILMYGPPGCGKTKLAKAIAGEAQAAFLAVGPSDVLSKYVGESEASIRHLFLKAASMGREMESKCAILFFDEIDALGQSRAGGEASTSMDQTGPSSNIGGAAACDGNARRVLAELLIQMTRLNSSNGLTADDLLPTETAGYTEEDDEVEEGEDGGVVEDEEEITSHDLQDRSRDGDDDNSTGFVEKHGDDGAAMPSEAGSPRSFREVTKSHEQLVRVIVVAATNRPEDCDAALIRRFAIQVHVDYPTSRDRRKILERLFNGIDHNVTRLQFKIAANELERWTGSDLEKLAREAAMAPVRECIQAAALLKRSQISSKRPRPGGIRSKGQGPLAEPQEMLLQEFQNLRPVTFKDLEKAIGFVSPHIEVPETSSDDSSGQEED